MSSKILLPFQDRYGHTYQSGISDDRILESEETLNSYSPNNPNALKRAFGMACKRANIKGLRFHDLRHTAATRMIEEGVGIEKVSKILGHSTIQMTMRYAHPEDSLKDAVEKLANFCSVVSQSVSQQENEQP